MRTLILLAVASMSLLATTRAFPAAAQGNGQSDTGYTHSDLPVYVCADGTSSCAQPETCTDGSEPRYADADRAAAPDGSSGGDSGGYCTIGWPKVEVVIVPCPRPLWPRIPVCFIYVRITPSSTTALLTGYTGGEGAWIGAPPVAGERRWSISLEHVLNGNGRGTSLVSNLEAIVRYNQVLVTDERLNVRAYNEMVAATRNLRRNVLHLVEEWTAVEQSGGSIAHRAEVLDGLTQLVELVETLSEHLAAIESAATHNQRL